MIHYYNGVIFSSKKAKIFSNILINDSKIVAIDKKNIYKNAINLKKSILIPSFVHPFSTIFTENVLTNNGFHKINAENESGIMNEILNNPYEENFFITHLYDISILSKIDVLNRPISLFIIEADVNIFNIIYMKKSSLEKKIIKKNELYHYFQMKIDNNTKQNCYGDLKKEGFIKQLEMNIIKKEFDILKEINQYIFASLDSYNEQENLGVNIFLENINNDLQYKQNYTEEELSKILQTNFKIIIVNIFTNKGLKLLFDCLQKNLCFNKIIIKTNLSLIKYYEQIRNQKISLILKVEDIINKNLINILEKKQIKYALYSRKFFKVFQQIHAILNDFSNIISLQKMMFIYCSSVFQIIDIKKNNCIEEGANISFVKLSDNPYNKEFKELYQIEILEEIL